MCGTDMSKESGDEEEGNFFDEAFKYWQRGVRYLSGEEETTKPKTGKVFNRRQDGATSHSLLMRAFGDLQVQKKYLKIVQKRK